MRLDEFHREQGATLAGDGIPLHYGDLQAEYQAGLETAVLMDRSHEGRLMAQGRDRLALLQRISTNDVLNMQADEGRPTILTNATGRMIDRLMVYNQGENTLITTEPGRGESVRGYLQRQVFFNDDFRLHDLAGETRLFTLHGPEADQVIETLTDKTSLQTGDGAKRQYRSVQAEITGIKVTLAERKGLSGGQWAIIAPLEQAAAIWIAVMEAGKSRGLRAAGSLAFNTLRIRAGRPGVGRELSQDYIPLEAGLWDEVSFSKGCYTGQEIIARMESRGKLAKAMVRLELAQMIDAPAQLYAEGKLVGTLTSSVETPQGERVGIGFVKLNFAEPEQTLTAGEQGTAAKVVAMAGIQEVKG
ncbi:MAG: folate-binding protein YgfZ [Anaerolineae bacterium]|nr:folate-binding protein YgfZ [Anaerolineae bacterium]